MATHLSGDDFLERLRHAAGDNQDSASGRSWSKVVRSLKGTLQAPPTPPTLSDVPFELANDPHYEVLRELGRGGMGVVYLARHRISGRQEVLKVMSRDLLAQPDNKERFRREIQSAASLDHPNVVKMYTATEFGELMVLVMEYVEGEDLSKRLHERGRLPILNSCYYAQQAAMALQHAHERRMVHRDIKPQNMILVRTGEKHTLKVLDFGLAKVKSENNSDPGLTGTGMMLGTPHYMAPEQAMDAAQADIRADIYSLGCTLYQFLTGAMPFTGRSHFEVLQAHHAGAAKPVQSLRPELPEGLPAVVHKMMAKDPAQRYQEPKEVVAALAAFVRQAAKAQASGPVQATLQEKAPAQALVATPAPSGRETSVPKKRTAATAVEKMDFAKKLESKTKPEPEGLQLQPGRKNRWPLFIGSLAALIVLALLAGVIIKIKTANGVLVLEDLSKDAEVFVDGERVTVAWGPDGKNAEIHVKPGTRKIVAKRDGVEVIGEEVVIAEGRREVLRARLEPPGLPKAQIGDGKPSASDGKDSLDQWFAVGTKWEGKHVIAEATPLEGAVWFTVNSRDGNRFRGRAVNEWRDDMTIEGVLNDDRTSFTWKFVDHAVNQWKPDRKPVETMEASGNWKEGQVRIDFEMPGLGGDTRRRHWEFSAKKLITRPEESYKWPLALHPGNANCSPTGKWLVQDRELVQEEVVQDAKNPAWLNFGELSWVEYDLRLKAMKTGGENGVIVMFDALRPTKQTQWCIGLRGNRSSYVESCEFLPSGIQLTNRAGNIPLTIQNHRWYDILIKTRGKQIECFLDGNRQFQFTDPDRNGGRIGITCIRMSARFKDIEITAADGTVLWKGPPKLP